MSDKPITITIKGKVGYEDEITVSQAAQIIAFLNADEGEAALGAGLGAGLGDSLRGDGSKTNSQGGKKVATAREALDLSGAKTNPEKIVALGQYVLQDDGVETFKVDEVKAQFRRARETVPANFSRDLTAAVKAGWIAEGDGDEFYITNNIEGIFDGDFKFPKTNGGGGGGRSSKRTSTKAKVKPEVFAGIDEFPTRMEGVPPYSKMKTDKDRLLWALHFAKSRDIKGLANKDLAWITDHLGVGVASGNISSNFRSGKNAGHMNRSTVDDRIRITDDGETYLKSAGATDA